MDFAVYDAADPDDSHSLFEIFGPVTLDPQDQRSLAQQSSNNTATAIAETLIWLRDEAPGPTHTPAEIAYDSHYAANLTLGTTEPHANHELAARAQSIPGSK